MEFNEIITLCIFILVYAMIMTRTRLKNIPFWLIMFIGAILVLGFGIISIDSALKSVNLQVIGFLFGMFSITSALEKSGVLNYVIRKVLIKINKVNHILIIIVILSGLLAAFIVNDTAAIILIPFATSISKQLGIKPSVILVSIAIGINIGSVMTPIGSPQNLLIASQSGVSMPFITFLSILGPPTIINLFLSGLVLHFCYKKNMYILSLSQEQKLNDFNDSINHYNNNNRIDEESKIKSGLIRFSFSNKFAKISVIVFLSTLGAIVLSEVFNLLFNVVYLDIGTISLLGAASLYIFCKERISILKSVNYSVLIFFIGMFIFTSALWTSGLISDILQLFPPVSSDNTYNNLIYDNAIISAVSIILSQILSNVPFVATYNLYMIQNGFDKDDVYSWLMLAAASTVAGNLTIFGAASNIIIMQTAESRGVKVFTFLEFLKIGSAITGLNIVVLYLFLIFHSSYNL